MVTCTGSPPPVIKAGRTVRLRILASTAFRASSGCTWWDRSSIQVAACSAPVVPLVTALIDAGFADHILISGDAFRGYARPITVFAPKLKAAGVDDATLHRITVDNPRRFLAFVPKRPRVAAG